MIEQYRNLKKIALVDGKYYTSNEITAIDETDDNIELTTRKDYVVIPKASISRIEYYYNEKGVVAGGNRYR